MVMNTMKGEKIKGCRSRQRECLALYGAEEHWENQRRPPGGGNSTCTGL